MTSHYRGHPFTANTFPVPPFEVYKTTEQKEMCMTVNISE